MLGGAYGLYGHIRGNRVRSVFLLAGLFCLAYVLTFGVILIGYGVSGAPMGQYIMREAGRVFLIALPFVTAATLLWVFIGFRFNVAMIDAMAGSHPVSQAENPKLYRLLENLCIARGIPMPKLAILETDALNAFASGVNEKQFTVTVTTGLMNALNDQELEGVLAHELTHIRNGDVRLMIIAVVIAGVISLVGEIVFRNFLNGGFRSSSDSDRKGGFIAVVIGVALVAASWLLASVVRLSLSRSREYLADAGAVELTKNPDAMITALMKISGRAEIEGVPSGIMDMCIENESNSFSDLFSTHPSIDKRIKALVDKAGGRMPLVPPQIPASAGPGDQPTIARSSGWGRGG